MSACFHLQPPSEHEQLIQTLFQIVYSRKVCSAITAVVTEKDFENLTGCHARLLLVTSLTFLRTMRKQLTMLKVVANQVLIFFCSLWAFDMSLFIDLSFNRRKRVIKMVRSQDMVDFLVPRSPSFGSFQYSDYGRCNQPKA